MQKMTQFFLIVIFVGLSGSMMLGAGEHPGLVILVLGGGVLLLVRGNAIFDRSRARRGKPAEFMPTLMSAIEDYAAMTRRDWLELGATFVVAMALVATGVGAFGRAA